MIFLRKHARSTAILLSVFAFIITKSIAGNIDTGLQTLLVTPRNGGEFYRQLTNGNLLLDQQKWSEAEIIFSKLSQDYPLHGKIWGQLGVALRQQKKYADAIRAYEKVMEIQGPGLPYNARYWIAVSYAALGNTNAALDTLHQLVFNDAYLQRPELLADSNFAGLKNNSRFRAIAGKEDVSQLSRNEGWRHDIDYLAAELKRNNSSGAPIPEEFWRRQRELKASLPKLNDFQIVMGMSHMLNALDRGHTALWLGFPGAKVDFRPMPIHLYIFPEGIFITQGLQGYSDLAGAQVLAFDKTSAAEAIRRMQTARSKESAMEDLWISPRMLEMPAVLKGLGITQQSDRAELTLKMPDGSKVIKTLNVIEMSEPNFKLAPPPSVKPPLFLSKVKEVHWLEELPQHNAIYVQINNIMSDKDETMPQFGIRLRQVINETKPSSIIVDLRHNNGGNTFTYQEVLRTLTAFSTIEENKVYVLIGRNVYSAAANFCTDLERMVKPIFVGEPTSATGNQWGDESQFVLPYSRITGAFSGLRWQLSHPWDKRHSIVPDVPVQLTAKDYFQGNDPALDAIFHMITTAETN